jgi:hypothetical protein
MIILLKPFQVTQQNYFLNLHVSSYLLRDTEHPLYPSINWKEKGRKKIVIVDPFQSDRLLYLTGPDYVKLCNVALSQGREIEVLADFTDHQESVEIGSKRSTSPADDNHTTNSPSHPNSMKWTERVLKQSTLNARITSKQLKTGVLSFARHPKYLLGTSLKGDKQVLFKGILYYSRLLYYLITTKPISKSLYMEIKIWTIRMEKIYSNAGFDHLMKIMKAQYIIVAGFVLKAPYETSKGLGVCVSIKDGLPTLLPQPLRLRIRMREPNLVRFVLSILYLYKGISAPKGHKYNISFKTITNPTSLTKEDELASKSTAKRMVHYLTPFTQKYFRVPIHSLGVSNDTPSELLPSISLGKDFHGKSFVGSPGQFINLPVSVKSGISPFQGDDNRSIGSWYYDIAAWCNNGLWPLLDYAKSIGSETVFDKTFQGIINFEKKFGIHTGSKSGYGYPFSEKLPEPIETDSFESVHIIPTGRLALKMEAAGKVRVFAIMDNLTQWLLKPLHKVLFSCLRKLPCDSTFNQMEGVSRIAKWKSSYRASLDLTAATDRIPIYIYEEILSHIFGKSLAKAWVILISKRDFYLPSIVRKDNAKKGLTGPESSMIRYAVGQPMGCYSSWAMLAIAHHYIVRYSAGLAGYDPNEFAEYEVLGDDIVIGCPRVTEQYLKLMKGFGIDISLPKSFLSYDKGFQFASELVIGETVYSPLSIRQVIASQSPSARLSLAEWIISRYGYSGRPNHLWAVLLRMISPDYYLLIKDNLNTQILHNPILTTFLRLVLNPFVDRSSTQFDLSKLSVLKDSALRFSLWERSLTVSSRLIHRVSQAFLGMTIPQPVRSWVNTHKMISSLKLVMCKSLRNHLTEVKRLSDLLTEGTESILYKKDLSPHDSLLRLVSIPTLVWDRVRETSMKVSGVFMALPYLYEYWKGTLNWKRKVVSSINSPLDLTKFKTSVRSITYSGKKEHLHDVLSLVISQLQRLSSIPDLTSMASFIRSLGVDEDNRRLQDPSNSVLTKDKDSLESKLCTEWLSLYASSIKKGSEMSFLHFPEQSDSLVKDWVVSLGEQHQSRQIIFKSEDQFTIHDDADIYRSLLKGIRDIVGEQSLLINCPALLPSPPNKYFDSFEGLSSTSNYRFELDSDITPPKQNLLVAKAENLNCSNSSSIEEDDADLRED